jgi:hypothetical protein
MAELMYTHADLRIFRDGQKSVHIRSANNSLSVKHPFDGPDIIHIAGLFGSSPSVDNDESIHIAIAVIIVISEVRKLSNSRCHCILTQISSIRSNGSCGSATPGIPIGIVGFGMRHSEGPDYPPDQGDVAATHVVVILTDTAISNTTWAEKQSVKVCGVVIWAHLLVAKIDQHDDNAAEKR